MSDSTASRLGRVLIVGAGSMGQAIAAGLLRIEGMQPRSICMANPGAAKRELVEQRWGVETVADARDGLPADTVVLAVKPNVVSGVASQLAAAGLDARVVISVAAGISTSTLAEALGHDVPIVRVMPNTPLLCGQGMSAVCAGPGARPDDVQLVRDVFGSMGRAVVVDEGDMDAVTALSGSGPAYFELVAETLARSGEQLGLSYDVARELALQTMYGTASLVLESGQSLPDAIEAVSSPGGTTVAALEAMRAGGIEQALESGVEAAARRSRELGA